MRVMMRLSLSSRISSSSPSRPALKNTCREVVCGHDWDRQEGDEVGLILGRVTRQERTGGRRSVATGARMGEQGCLVRGEG